MSAKLGKRTVTPRFLAPDSQINLEKYNVSAISGRFCAPSALGDPTNNQAYFRKIAPTNSAMGMTPRAIAKAMKMKLSRRMSRR